MESVLIEVGRRIVNLSAVAAAKWDGDTLYVYLVGGRFLSVQGDEADVVWNAISARASRPRSGEAVGSSSRV